MLTGDKNIEYEILNNLNDRDLFAYFRTNKKARHIYNDQDFWMNRIQIKFPYISFNVLRKYKEDRKWSEYYLQDLRRLMNEICSVNRFFAFRDSVCTGRLDHLIMALKHGTNINVQNHNLDTALMSSSDKGYLDIVKYLVDNGADINIQDYHGKTALSFASDKGYLDIVKYLVDNGADINRSTALISASYKGYLDIVKYLIENGADINIQTRNGRTAFLAAGWKGHLEIVKYLVENGANPMLC